MFNIIFPIIQGVMLTYTLLYFGILLLTYDALASNFVSFIQTSSEHPLTLTFMTILHKGKNSKNFVIRRSMFRSATHLFLGKGGMTVGGRVLVVGGVLAASFDVAKTYINSRAAGIEAERNRQYAYQEAERNRQAASQEAERNREHEYRMAKVVQEKKSSNNRWWGGGKPPAPPS